MKEHAKLRALRRREADEEKPTMSSTMPDPRVRPKRYRLGPIVRALRVALLAAVLVMLCIEPTLQAPHSARRELLARGESALQRAAANSIIPPVPPHRPVAPERYARHLGTDDEDMTKVMDNLEVRAIPEDYQVTASFSVKNLKTGKVKSTSSTTLPPGSAIDPTDSEFAAEFGTEAPSVTPGFSRDQDKLNFGFSPAAKIICGTIYCILFFFGFAGNCYTITALKKRPNLSHVDAFIINLAISDLAVCVFVIPTNLFYGLIYGHWIWGLPLCKVTSLASGVSVFVSTFSMVVIAYLRHRLIVYAGHVDLAEWLVKVLIMLSWFIGLVTMSPIFYYTDLAQHDVSDIKLCVEQWPTPTARTLYTMFLMALQLLIPTMLLCNFYCRIYGRISLQERHRVMRREAITFGGSARGGGTAGGGGAGPSAGPSAEPSAKPSAGPSADSDAGPSTGSGAGSGAGPGAGPGAGADKPSDGGNGLRKGRWKNRGWRSLFDWRRPPDGSAIEMLPQAVEGPTALAAQAGAATETVADVEAGPSTSARLDAPAHSCVVISMDEPSRMTETVLLRPEQARSTLSLVTITADVHFSSGEQQAGGPRDARLLGGAGAARSDNQLSKSTDQLAGPMAVAGSAAKATSSACTSMKEFHEMKDKQDEDHLRRFRRVTHLMVLAVVLFIACWLLLNMFNLVVDSLNLDADATGVSTFFLISHVSACSSVVINPILYAWMSENYREELINNLPKWLGRWVSEFFAPRSTRQKATMA